MLRKMIQGIILTSCICNEASEQYWLSVAISGKTNKY